jgi:hypothetical protein
MKYTKIETQEIKYNFLFTYIQVRKREVLVRKMEGGGGKINSWNRGKNLKVIVPIQ